MHHYQMDKMGDVFFQSEATRRGKSGLRIISIKNAVSNYDVEFLYNLPFLHAWSGCDSSSISIVLSNLKMYVQYLETIGLTKMIWKKQETS